LCHLGLTTCAVSTAPPTHPLPCWRIPRPALALREAPPAACARPHPGLPLGPVRSVAPLAQAGPRTQPPLEVACADSASAGAYPCARASTWTLRTPWPHSCWPRSVSRGAPPSPCNKAMPYPPAHLHQTDLMWHGWHGVAGAPESGGVAEVPGLADRRAPRAAPTRPSCHTGPGLAHARQVQHAAGGWVAGPDMLVLSSDHAGLTRLAWLCSAACIMWCPRSRSRRVPGRPGGGGGAAGPCRGPAARRPGPDCHPRGEGGAEGHDRGGARSALG
jgi:hypothetical protein